MSTSSIVLDRSLNSQESLSATPDWQRESDRLKLLLDMTATLVSTLECRDLLRAVSASIRQVMHCDIVGVWLPDAERVYLRQLAMDFPESKGFAKEDALQPIAGSVIGTVFRAGEPVILDLCNEQLAPHVGTHVRAEGLESGCALPLISRGRTVGVLTLASRFENSIRPEDADFLMRAAGQLAIAIENRLAYREVAELKDKLAQEKLYLEDEIRGELDFEGIVGQSSALRHVLNLVETVAPSDSTVLLLGETGTGKELIARAIHERSRRKERTFVKLNCAAIPTGLLESELFGHERGAFTGAIAQKIGRLELADQGTLFLDEVGDIPIEIQPKLLRALQEREFERLGSNRTKQVDVRLVAATNRDLEKMMEDREFRSDLYYRLNVFPIRIPPLRERPDDIPLLVRYFTQKYGRRMQKQIESIPAEALKKLSLWHWPGNIRELENFIERSVILTRGTALQAPIAELGHNSTHAPVASTREANERDEIVRFLKMTNGRVAGPDGAAARMDVKRTTLVSRMKRLGIDPQRVL
ncbi:MAG: sigma 54-interacting transcriptional regulator [Candidatus Sulfotelmatobacter sp.]